MFILRFALVPLMVASANKEIISKFPCKDPLSSQSLSEAVDAALVSLHGENGWLHNLRQSTGYVHPIEVTSCTPKASMWSWPDAATADGLLADVLQTGKLRVAGVQWKLLPAADYKTNGAAPTGFWPEYMNAIAKAMTNHYGKTISVERVYYPNSDLVNQAVANGTDVHMSEPYYYLGGFHDSKPRIEALHVSCITIATASAFSSAKSSGIKTMDQLYSKIVSGPNRKVGFIGAGNFDAVSHVLPTNVEPIYITESATMEQQVNDGTLLARYISEASATESDTHFVYETGVISPRVALFRQDSTTACVHNAALQEVATLATNEAKGSESKQTEEACEDNTSLMMITVILAAVVFLLTCLVTVLICKERAGKPLFYTPLEEKGGAGGQVIGNSM
jgi:hypothetical protein